MERTDLVCGMTVEDEQPRYTTDYDGKSYAFCSAECKRQFDDHPDRFIQEQARRQMNLT
jgi:YHS domain-containing protein